MNLRIVIYYSVLTSLMMLLWLMLEFMVGLRDKYIAFLNYSTCLSLIVLVFGIWRMLKGKLQQKAGRVGFGEAFFTAFLITLFTAILLIPAEYFYANVINPDYFDNLKEFYIHKAMGLGANALYAREEAEKYFCNYIIIPPTIAHGHLVPLKRINLPFALIEPSIVMLVFGTSISLFWSWWLSAKRISL